MYNRFEEFSIDKYLPRTIRPLPRPCVYLLLCVFIVGNVDVLHTAINGENVTKRFIERYLPLLLDIVVAVDG